MKDVDVQNINQKAIDEMKQEKYNETHNTFNETQEAFNRKPSVGIGLSGGVDSALVAALLMEQGYEVRGYTMQVIDEMADLPMAEAIAKQLGIPWEVVDFREAFKASVITPWREAYIQGCTPNPCILCNRHIKYGQFATYILEHCDYMATGHYARVEKDPIAGNYQLFRGAADRKDQAYVLYQLPQEILSRLLLPLGAIENKQETREMAQKRGIVVADKKDSDGICFLPKNTRYSEFIQNAFPQKNFAGEIVHVDGRKLGTHPSYFDFTIGQKRNEWIRCDKGESVVSIQPDTGTVVIGSESLLYEGSCKLTDLRFVAESVQDLHGIVIKLFQWGWFLEGWLERIEGETFLHFKEPVRGIAKGQSAVFYEKSNQGQPTKVLGGGIVS